MCFQYQRRHRRVSWEVLHMAPGWSVLVRLQSDCWIQPIYIAVGLSALLTEVDGIKLVLQCLTDVRPISLIPENVIGGLTWSTLRDKAAFSHGEMELVVVFSRLCGIQSVVTGLVAYWCWGLTNGNPCSSCLGQNLWIGSVSVYCIHLGLSLNHLCFLVSLLPTHPFTYVYRFQNSKMYIIILW